MELSITQSGYIMCEWCKQDAVRLPDNISKDMWDQIGVKMEEHERTCEKYRELKRCKE